MEQARSPLHLLRQAARNTMPLVETIAAKRPAVSRAVGLKLVTTQAITTIMSTTAMKMMKTFL
jgi:hypothetical protein